MTMQRPGGTMQQALIGPALLPRTRSGERDELGYPLLDYGCPFCAAMALTINEWDAIECLTCSWREFGPDSPRAAFRDPELEAP